MNLSPNLQKKLYGFESSFLFLQNLIEQNKLPNKLIFSGLKGIGKCTFAYHVFNYIFSKHENESYDIKKKEIKENNRSYNLIVNNSHPNFFLIDIKDQKNTIDISQIRQMINYTNKSSFDSREKIILIDNIEYLNLNAVNALLKVIEEPNENVFFFLIHNIEKKISSTLKSRCIEFKLSLNNSEKIELINSLTEENFFKNLSLDFKNYYIYPGIYINFYHYCKTNNIDFKNITIDVFLKNLILKNENKKNIFLKENLINFIEFFFAKKINNYHKKNEIYDLYKSIAKKIYLIKKYNLDLESFLIELNTKLINE